jgi:hypothetical protein
MDFIDYKTKNFSFKYDYILFDSNSWDYKQWVGNNLYNQMNWNKTLLTKINQQSAKIFKSSGIMGGTNILTHHILAPLFYEFEYYNAESSILCGRYEVQFTNNIENNIIKIYNIYNEKLIKIKNYDY